MHHKLNILRQILQGVVCWTMILRYRHDYYYQMSTIILMYVRHLFLRTPIMTCHRPRRWMSCQHACRRRGHVYSRLYSGRKQRIQSLIRDDSLSSTINPQMFAKDHNSGNMETTCLRSKFVEHVYTLSTSSPIGNFNSQPSNSMVHLDSQASAQKHRAALEEMVEIFHNLPRTAIHDCVCACVPPKGQNQLYELSGAGASCRNLGKGAGRDQWWCSIAN